MRFLCTPLKKIAGRLRLCAPPYENCRQSQALRTRTHENGGASQAVCMPLLKIADSLRRCAPALTKIVGRLRRLACPRWNCRQSQALSAFCALHSRNFRDASGFLHPHDKICRQSQALCTPPHENCGTSQALCTPLTKFAGRLRLCAPSYENGRQLQAPSTFSSTPLTKFSGRLRLSAPP